MPRRDYYEDEYRLEKRPKTEPWALYPAAVVTEMRRPQRSTRRIRGKRDSQLCQMLQADRTDPVLTMIILTRLVVVAGWGFHYPVSLTAQN